MIDLHEEIMEIATGSFRLYLPQDFNITAVAYDLATDILKLVNDNYISKENFNNQYKEGNWR